MKSRNPKSGNKKPEKAKETSSPSAPTEATPSKPETNRQPRIIPPKAGRPRSSDESVARRQDAAYRMALLGKTPEEIGEALGVAQTTVYGYIAKGKERQMNELRKLEGRAGVMRQFAVLNHILDEMLDRWEASKRTVRTKVAGVETKDVTLGPGGKALPSTETKKKSSQKEVEELGDVAYIDRALRASKEIRELLGLDAPEVKRLLLAEDPVTKDLNDEDLRTLPTEELLRRYRAAAGLSSELG